MTSPTSQDGSVDQKHYTIGAVARLTGLSTQLIRAWEQRYEAVVAARSENGRRIYTTADVEKLGLLKALTERGIAISTIANLDREMLRERVGEADRVALRPLDRSVRVVALGSYLPRVLKDQVAPSNPIELAASGANTERFLADAKGLEADVLLVELASITPDSLEQLTRFRDTVQAQETLVAYNFARGEDERQLSAEGFRLLRSPLSADELAVAILAAAVKLRAGDHFSPRDEPLPARRPPVNPPPRRFSEAQLATLSQIKSAVDCECPNHMADVVQTLSAFESYCAQCEDRNDADAALHAYLHQSTAEARALMESALAHLVEEEGLSI